MTLASWVLIEMADGLWIGPTVIALWIGWSFYCGSLWAYYRTAICRDRRNDR